MVRILNSNSYEPLGFSIFMLIQYAASQLVRVRRDDKYVAAASGGGSYGKGHVGPVYTFVKTDPKANFKWGVRHRAGVQYGRK